MDRIVIVTGGAQGIGLGIGKCFAAQGDTVVIADMKEEGARQAAAELKALGAPEALALVCDVSDRAQVERMVADALDACGRIDVLVNNAGICPFVDIMEMSPEMFERTIEVDLLGPFHCTQVVARHMIERGGGGRMIFITSLAAHAAGPAQVDYAAAKSGLRGLMFSFATALGPHGITSNAVAPGMILTPLTEFHWTQPGPAEMIKTRVPVGRLGTPEDIGHACVFLASPEAEYVNGISLRVDGGHEAVCA